jgi:hypothetical protein
MINQNIGLIEDTVEWVRAWKVSVEKVDKP